MNSLSLSLSVRETRHRDGLVDRILRAGEGAEQSLLLLGKLVQLHFQPFGLRAMYHAPTCPCPTRNNP